MAASWYSFASPSEDGRGLVWRWDLVTSDRRRLATVLEDGSWVVWATPDGRPFRGMRHDPPTVSAAKRSATKRLTALGVV